jgi:hypothetical protein
LTDFYRKLFDLIHALAKAKGLKRMVAYHQYGVYDYQDCYDRRTEVKNGLPLFFTELEYTPDPQWGNKPVTKKTKLILEL